MSETANADELIRQVEVEAKSEAEAKEFKEAFRKLDEHVTMPKITIKKEIEKETFEPKFDFTTKELKRRDWKNFMLGAAVGICLVLILVSIALNTGYL